MSHISTRRGKGRVKWRPYFQQSAKVAEVTSTGNPQTGGGIRQGITTWSNSSRRRLVKTWEAIDWSPYEGRLLWIGLTYPAEGPEDGHRCKRHLEAFKMRWTRRWGPPVGGWKLEFQRRGVPHFHLLLVKPAEFDLLECHRMWFEVVNSGDDAHLIQGCHVVDWVGENAAGYVVGYGAGDSKEYQNTAPAEWWTGRWWGIWGGLKPDWKAQELTEKEFHRIRRVMRGLVRARSRKNKGRKGRFVRRRYGGKAGTWIRGKDLHRLLELTGYDK